MNSIIKSATHVNCSSQQLDPHGQCIKFPALKLSLWRSSKESEYILVLYLFLLNLLSLYIIGLASSPYTRISIWFSNACSELTGHYQAS